MEKVSRPFKVGSVMSPHSRAQTFFLNNELNVQLDSLLKNDLCPAIQSLLEHGLKPSGRDLSSTKRIILWKIIEISVDHGRRSSPFIRAHQPISVAGQVPRVYQEAKQTAQAVSSNWLYRFHAFIFALLKSVRLLSVCASHRALRLVKANWSIGSTCSRDRKNCSNSTIKHRTRSCS